MDVTNIRNLYTALRWQVKWNSRQKKDGLTTTFKIRNAILNVTLENYNELRFTNLRHNVRYNNEFNLKIWYYRDFGYHKCKYDLRVTCNGIPMYWTTDEEPCATADDPMVIQEYLLYKPRGISFPYVIDMEFDVEFTITKSYPETYVNENNVTLKNIREYEQRRNTDLAIRVNDGVDNRVFDVHREVMRRMFVGQPIPNRHILMEGESPYIVRVMLDFTYFYKFPRKFKRYEDLYVLAKKYNFKILMRECWESIFAKINDDY